MRIIQRSRCPECAKHSKDNHHDNLATYSDGHSYCYSCGYYTNSSGIAKIKNEESNSSKKEPTIITIPYDFNTKIPFKCFKWLNKYLDINTILYLTKNNLLGYSNYYQRLLFLFLDENNNLLAWQGRYFGNQANKPKWLTSGKIHDILAILPKDSNNHGELILVEDIISAHKVALSGKQVAPLWGSVILPSLLTRLTLLGYNKLIIWLDPDKRKESIKFKQKCETYGFQTKIIFSDKDPKDYSLNEIDELLIPT
jgi:hypothetical protein